MIGSPLRILLDTHVVDALSADVGLLEQLRTAVEQGHLSVMITHLQIDEVIAIPENHERAAHREALVNVLAQLPAERIPTYGFVVGRSRIENARITDDVGSAFIERLRDGNLRHTVDAVLIATAWRDDAVFVTNDRRARRVARSNGVEALSVHELRHHLAQA
jgi:rRNA-processing protein FCF1